MIPETVKFLKQLSHAIQGRTMKNKREKKSIQMSDNQPA